MLIVLFTMLSIIRTCDLIVFLKIFLKEKIVICWEVLLEMHTYQ